MKWFNVTKVNAKPSRATDMIKGVLEGVILDAADMPLYKFLDSDSLIEFYDMGNYFLARQYMIDRSTRTKTFYAAYRLNLTDEAWAIVDTLLREPFTCDVKQSRPLLDGKLHYRCSTQHSAYIPHPTKAKLEKGAWVIGMLPYPIPRIGPYRGYTTIPFNCGPLRPLWKQAVECWIEKIRELGSRHVAEIKDALLQYRDLDTYIVPVYPL